MCGDNKYDSKLYPDALISSPDACKNVYHHHRRLHGLGFLKACSGFKISYKSCL
jgi:hypothetical protein